MRVRKTRFRALLAGGSTLLLSVFALGVYLGATYEVAEPPAQSLLDMVYLASMGNEVAQVLLVGIVGANLAAVAMYAYFKP